MSLNKKECFICCICNNLVYDFEWSLYEDPQCESCYNNWYDFYYMPEIGMIE